MDWKRKLTSRKFWSSVVNFVSMLIIAFNGSQELATKITALILAGAGVVAYIIGEGLADAAAVEQDLRYTAGRADLRPHRGGRRR